MQRGFFGTVMMKWNLILLTDVTHIEPQNEVNSVDHRSKEKLDERSETDKG